MGNRGRLGGHASRQHEKKVPAYCPPSDFRVNVEAGLRTALSLGLTFVWLRFGPFEGGLSFFAGVTAVVCVGNSAGQTISRSLMMTHGALIGTVCAILPRWLMKWGAFPAGAGFFVAIFLVLRSRRLTSLGKKFGCVGVTIVVLGRVSSDGLTASWWRFASSFPRVNVEGGFFALVASLLPYPRFATRDGALRAQFICRSLSAAVDACVTGFIKARDETSISRARLLCLQVRQNLEVVRMELQWSRLELGLLCGGFCAGGMQSADALEELSELMEEVLQGVRGMRQSMLDMHRTRAQASFSRVVGSALRGLAAAVDDTLEATSRRSALLPASILACCHRARFIPPALPPGNRSNGTRVGVAGHGDKNNITTAITTTTTTNNNETVNNGTVNNGADSTAVTGSNTGIDEEAGLHFPPERRQSSLRETTERLEDAVAAVMRDYQRARKEVLYGLDDLGRPLEEAAASADRGADGSGHERSTHHRPSSSRPREPVPLKNLQNLAMRDFSATNTRDSSGSGSAAAAAMPPPGLDESMMSAPRDTGSASWARGGPGALADTPNHVLVMKERQKLGGSATMARGAFLFSLSGLCAALGKERVSHTGGWRASHSAEALRYVLSGTWKAVRPPPGLATAVSAAARLAYGWCCRCVRSRCGGGGGSRHHARRRKDEAKAALKRLGSGGLGQGESSSPAAASEAKEKAKKASVRGKGRLAAVSRSGYFWCFKVSVALTLCAVFSLSPFLAELFDPPLWIAVTTSFVMENQSASAITTCLLRLVGTVLGAVYGILAAKLTNQPEDEPYSFQAHAVLLPWVAIACFFRNSSQFSYAALVAAFTAVVIFTGSNTVLGADGEAVSLARIVNTVVGSVIYLFVDMLFVPTRAKGLVLEQVYISLDAAFQEISINGERMFGPVVCPLDSRARFLQALNRSRSRSESVRFLGPEGVPPLPPPPRGGALPSSSRGADRDGSPRQGEEITRHGSGGGEGGRAEDNGCPPSAVGAAASAVAGSWGQLPSVGQLLPGFSSEKPGFLAGAPSLISSGDGMSSPGHRRSLSRPGGDDDNDGVQGGGGWGGRSEGGEVLGKNAGGDEGGGHAASEEERERRAGSREEAASATATAWSGHRKEAGCIRRMVGALTLQKRYLPLAELEPQLWYKPFSASAYQGMVAAQEELLRALTLLTKAAIAVSEDRSTKWRQELTELGSHLASLVQLLKIALEDARDVFGGGELPKAFSYRNSSRGDDDDDGGNDDGGGGSDGEVEGQGVRMRMLDVQADAMRLNADVQSDFVMFIQAFIDRGAFPVWELESILRISTAVISVMGVQRALLTLGHAVATVVDRESYGSFYR